MHSLDNPDTVLDYLMQQGAIVYSGVDIEGNILYSFTPKLKEILPELYDAHIKRVNQDVMALWEKGFVDVHFFEDNPTVKLTKKAFIDEEIDKLSDDEKYSIEEVKRAMQGKPLL